MKWLDIVTQYHPSKLSNYNSNALPYYNDYEVKRTRLSRILYDYLKANTSDREFLDIINRYDIEESDMSGIGTLKRTELNKVISEYKVRVRAAYVEFWEKCNTNLTEYEKTDFLSKI